MNDAQRRRRFIAYFEQKYRGDRGRFIQDTGLTKGRVAQLFDEDQPFGERAAHNLTSKLRLSPDFFDRDQDEGPALLESSNDYAEVPVKRELDTLAHNGDDAPEGCIALELLAVRGSMGYGVARAEQEDVVTRMEVDERWLRRVATFTAVENLALITGKGDSMRPTFDDGDPLLVDRGVHDIKMDAVYVLAVNDDLYIKRLQRRPDGSLLMLSDNPQYQPYHITNGEKNKVEVLGRVLLAWNAKRV